MNLSFRIRRVYFNQIIVGDKKSEIRKASPFWEARVTHAMRELYVSMPVVAVFVCGRNVHRRFVESIQRYPDAVSALGRQPSEQGRLDLGDGPVFKFNLGAKAK